MLHDDIEVNGTHITQIPPWNVEPSPKDLRIQFCADNPTMNTYLKASGRMSDGQEMLVFSQI